MWKGWSSTVGMSVFERWGGWPVGRMDAAELAHSWRMALSDIGFVPMPKRELDLLLTGMVLDLVDALAAESLDPTVGARIGAELVRVNLTDPQVLARSARVLSRLTDATDRHDRGDRLMACWVISPADTPASC
jgi:hypothetical protein